MTDDDELRKHFAEFPVPEFSKVAFAKPPRLAEATLAIVTTAALHRPDDMPFGRGDTTFRVLDRNDRDLRLGHRSLNFDRSGVAIDLNVVYPIDRIQELAADGTIGEVAPHHLAFTGAQADTLSQVQMDTGPVAARQLVEDGVNVVLFAPVCPLCTRTICTLAHVFEAAGLATVALVSMRSVAERMRPPRALYCEFPLGRPLGIPNDPQFQHDVLRRALSLLDAKSGPVLQDHPEVIVAEEGPLTCPLPPRYDPRLPPAVDEARGLRAAYDRSRLARGRTSVGRLVDPEGVPEALRLLGSIASGTPWQEADIPGGDTVAVVLDVRSYYEEAALELIDGAAPGSRQTERWFYESTEAGRTVKAAREAMRSTAAPIDMWFNMVPGHR